MSKKILFVTMICAFYITGVSSQNIGKGLIGEFGSFDGFKISGNVLHENLSEASKANGVIGYDRAYERVIKNNQNVLNTFYFSSEVKQEITSQLKFLDTLVQSDNYRLLNEVYKQGYFTLIEFNENELKPGDSISLTVDEIYFDRVNEILEGSKLLGNHFCEVIQIAQVNNQIEPLSAFSNNKEQYAGYLLDHIKELLQVFYLKLKCEFSKYLIFESRKNLSNYNEIIEHRYNFIEFCYGKIN